MPEPLTRAFSILQDSIAQFLANLPSLIIAVIVLYLGYRISQPIADLVKKTLANAKRSENIQLILSRISRWIIIFFGFLFAAIIAIPGFDPSELLSLLGIGSVAIGFAFRDILQNFLAGILILLTEPFHLNDQIIVGDYEGTVEDIQIRATFLRTYDNRRVVIPNSDLFTDSVTVNTAYGNRRSEYDVGIGYEDDIAAAQSLCLEVLRETQGVLDQPAPDTVMMELGDSAVVFRVRWWTDSRKADVLHVQDRVLREIKNRLTQAGFNIPFPIRTVYLNQVTEPAQKT